MKKPSELPCCLGKKLLRLFLLLAIIAIIASINFNHFFKNLRKGDESD